MALKQPYAVKYKLGAGDLELRADPGESFLIKNIKAYNPATNYVTLRVEKTTVGFFRIGGPLGSHLPFFQGRSNPLISDHSGSAVVVADHAALAAHKHRAFKHIGSAAGADQTLFVELQDGELVSVGANVLAKSGRTTDIEGNTNLISGGIPDTHLETVTQPDRHGIAIIPSLMQKSLLAWMIEEKLLMGYPVAEGETFKLSGVGQAGSIQLVEYEIYDAEDQKPDLPNGSKAMEYIYLAYGNTGAVINKVGDSLYNMPASPTEFPAFPFGADVPAKTKIDLHSVLASDFAPAANDGTNSIWTLFIKLLSGREILFDEDRNGLLHMGPAGANIGGRDRVGEGWSLLGNYSDIDMKIPFCPPAPISFSSGDEMLLYLTTDRVGTGQTIAVDRQEIALVQKVTRIE